MQGDLYKLKLESSLKLGMVGMLCISLFYILELLVDRWKLNELWNLVGLIIFAGIYYFLPEKVDNFYFMSRFFVIAVILHLGVSFCAHLWRDEEMSFWEMNKKLFINIVLTAIFTGVLTGGVMLAIGGVEQLFDINVDGKVYPSVAIFLAIVGSVIIFLHFVKDGLYELENPTPYPIVLKFFTQFILIPLMLIYGVILYAYMFKIIMEWELPRGWVSYLVNAYSVFGILALLLVHPLRESAERSWVKLFSKIFYFSLIPLVILMSIGIYRRVSDYGVTEMRYYSVLLAGWLLFIGLYFIIKQNARIKMIPISLAVLALFSLVTPYFNAFSYSLKSQTDRYRCILEENNMLSSSGRIDFDQPISLNAIDNLHSIQRYLRERKKISRLKEFFSDDVYEKHVEGYSNYQKFQALFPNADRSKGKELNEVTHVSLYSGSSNYETKFSKIDENMYILQSFMLQQLHTTLDNGYTIHMDRFENYGDRPQEAKIILMMQQDTLGSYDLFPWIKEKTASYDIVDDFNEYNEQDLAHRFKIRNAEFILAPKYMQYSKHKNDRDQYNLDGSLIITFKK